MKQTLTSYKKKLTSDAKNSYKIPLLKRKKKKRWKYTKDDLPINLHIYDYIM